MTRQEIQNTARSLIGEAESEVVRKPHWAWPPANVRLCNELLALADAENPSPQVIADLARRYESEIRRCRGVPSFSFLRCLKWVGAPGEPKSPDQGISRQFWSAFLLSFLWREMDFAELARWWFLWKELRKDQRRARGECTLCGYDLRASENRCPECGTPIAKVLEGPPSISE